VILNKRGQLFLDDDAARPAKNVAYKKYAQYNAPED
jgi:hypothetical protein